MSVTNEDLLMLVRTTIRLMGGDAEAVELADITADIRQRLLQARGAKDANAICRWCFPKA